MITYRNKPILVEHAGKVLDKVLNTDGSILQKQTVLPNGNTITNINRAYMVGLFNSTNDVLATYPKVTFKGKIKIVVGPSSIAIYHEVGGKWVLNMTHSGQPHTPYILQD